jgi:hypothetical protein
MRLQTRPLPIVQPKQSVTHSLAPANRLETSRGAENHVTLIRYRP